MSSRLSFYGMVILLAVCGVLVAILRHMETGVPFTPGEETEVWLVEARIDFRARGNPVVASLALPEVYSPGFELVEEQAASPGYGFSIVEENGDRRAEWTRREVDGDQSCITPRSLSCRVSPPRKRPRAAAQLAR